MSWNDGFSLSLSVSLSIKWGAYSDVVTSMPLCPLPHCFLQPLLALPAIIQPPPLLPPGALTANGPAHVLGERQTPTWHVEYLCKVKLWVTAKQTHTTRMSMLINFRVLLTKNQTITFVINGSFFLAAITPKSGNRLVNNKSAQNIEQEILNKSASWVSFTIPGSNRKRQSWPKDPSKKGNQDDTWWGDGMWYAQRGFYPSPRAASASENNLFPRNLIGKSSSQTGRVPPPVIPCTNCKNPTWRSRTMGTA